MNIPFRHEPVLKDSVLSFFKEKIGATLVDATAGGGGHLALLANCVGPSGHVLAFDRDLRAHQADAAGGVVAQNPSIIKMFHAPFSDIESTLVKMGITHIDGLLCDLGVSSNQLDDKSRGFSFMADGPIDMRMNTHEGLSAYEWLRLSSEEEIAHALFTFGGERKSRAIARLIKKSWPIENSTLALAKIIAQAMRQKSWSKTHPATRSFQALRIAVNDEMGELQKLILSIPRILAPGGVAVFISFHSLEDRVIKHSFLKLAQSGFSILTKKPVVASDEEIANNRRARSAKLRALMRLP